MVPLPDVRVVGTQEVGWTEKGGDHQSRASLSLAHWEVPAQDQSLLTCSHSALFCL